MIKQQELRTGNLVLLNKPLIPVLATIYEIRSLQYRLKYLRSLETTECYNIHNEDEIAAIALTIPILLMCGFVEQVHDELTWYDYPIKNSQFDFFTGDKNGMLEVVVEFNGEELKRVKYLHELQNLFFFLTGKELTVTI